LSIYLEKKLKAERVILNEKEFYKERFVLQRSKMAAKVGNQIS
jgi:hypothetical protein